MAKSMGGDLVLQLLHEFRESQQDYKHFKHEMLEFKQDYLGFKQDMLGFRDVMEVRMDLMQQSNVQTLGYLKHIVKMLQTMNEQLGATGQRVTTHDEQLGDHEQRLTKLEQK